MKTIAQELNVTDFPFVIKDKNNNQIYYEDSKGYWWKREFDKNNNEIYWEDSYSFWVKREFDKNNNKIYYENPDGFWEKREFDKNNNEIYYEDSNGYIIDKRPKSIPEYTMEELVAKLGYNFKIKK
jgi:hypothetical protein